MLNSIISIVLLASPFALAQQPKSSKVPPALKATPAPTKEVKAVVATPAATPTAPKAEPVPAVKSEFFYQAAPGVQVVTPEFNYIAITVETNNAGTPTKTEVKRTGVRVAYDYGINQMFSVGAALEYSTSKDEGNTPTTIEAGLNDIEVNFKGTYAMGPGNLRFGSELSYSLGDRKIEANGNSNAYTGGHILTPYLGYDMNLGKGVAGTKLARQMNLGKQKVDNNGVTTEYEGDEETQFDLFYEQGINADWNAGGALSYVQKADTKSNGTSTENINPTYLVRLYAPVKWGNAEVLPELRYSFTSDDKVEAAKIEKYDVLGFKVGYRMTF